MKKQRHVGIVPLLLVAGAVFLSFFWNLGSYGIFDLDEGLYVEAAREMNLRGDYIIPMVNGVEFFEKPPLVYWLSAASQLVLGQNEFAARLPAATASATLAILVFLIGNRFLGSKSGLLTGLAYALNPIVFGAGRQLTMDAVLALWMAAALFAFFKGYSAGEKGSAGWFYGFWACCAFGVLSKGAPGIVLPLVIVFVFLIMADGIGPGMRRFFTGTRMLFGIPLFLTIIIPWHAAAWQVGGRPFVDEYIIRQHLGRFRGGDTAHRAPFWFYVPGLLLGFFPWSFFAVPALFERKGSKEKSRNPAELLRLLCKVWFVVVFVTFSASGSKLISYILPLYAPAALLGADWAVRASARKERGAYLWATGLAMLISAALFIAVVLHEHVIAQVESATGRPVPMDQVTPAMIMFITALAGTAALACTFAWLLAVFKRPGASPGALCAGMATFIASAVFLGLPAVDAAYIAPPQFAARAAGDEAGREDRIVIISSARRPSLLFYLPDKLIPVQYSDSRRVIEITESRRFRDHLPSRPFLLVGRTETVASTKNLASKAGRAHGWSVVRYRAHSN